MEWSFYSATTSRHHDITLEVQHQVSLFQDADVGLVLFDDVRVNDADIKNSKIQVICVENPAYPTACDFFGITTIMSTNRVWRGKIYLRRKLDYETGPKLYQLLLQAKVRLTMSQNKVASSLGSCCPICVEGWEPEAYIP